MPDFSLHPQRGAWASSHLSSGSPQFTLRDPGPDSRWLRLGNCGPCPPTLSCPRALTGLALSQAGIVLTPSCHPLLPVDVVLLSLRQGVGGVHLPRPFLHAPLAALAQVLCPTNAPASSGLPALLLAAPSPPSHTPQLVQTSLTTLALGHFPTQGPTMALSAWLIKFKFPNLASGLLSLIWPLFPRGLHFLPPPLICILCSSLPTTVPPGFLPPLPHPGSSHQHPSQGQ